jgi:Tfp pilus assembly protein PilF
MADQKSLIIKLAHIYYHTGSWDKALVEYEKILAVDPNDWNVHATLGEIYVKKGDLEKAFRQYETAVSGFTREKNTKRAAGCYREMAGIIQKQVEPQDQEKAARMYRGILEKMPDSIETLQNLRDLFQRHNQIEEAVKYTLQLGDGYNKSDYIDKAENEFMKAVAMDPHNAEAKEKLAKIRQEIQGVNPPEGAV